MYILIKLFLLISVSEAVRSAIHQSKPLYTTLSGKNTHFYYFIPTFYCMIAVRMTFLGYIKSIYEGMWNCLKSNHDVCEYSIRRHMNIPDF